jgi:hypothetical protein
LEEDPILRFAARRDTDEFFFNFVVEKEEAREEENARSERDVDEVNMMMMRGFFFLSQQARVFVLCIQNALLKISSSDSILKP